MIAGGFSTGLNSYSNAASKVLDGVRSFLKNVENPDSSFRPGIDSEYAGTSDKALSGLAAPTYATILS